MRAVAAAVRSASLDRDFSRDAQLMVDQFDALTDEIEWQRELLAAENNELAPRLEDVDGQALLGDLAARHKGHEAARGKLIRLATTAPALLRTDVRLLRRVLGNMLKNALEASVAGQTVTLACQPVGDEIRFGAYRWKVVGHFDAGGTAPDSEPVMKELKQRHERNYRDRRQAV